MDGALTPPDLRRFTEGGSRALEYAQQAVEYLPARSGSTIAEIIEYLSGVFPLSPGLILSRGCGPGTAMESGKPGMWPGAAVGFVWVCHGSISRPASVLSTGAVTTRATLVVRGGNNWYEQGT